MDCAQQANVFASGLVALCCIVLALVYHLIAPWRSTVFGRNLMAFTLAIGGLCAYTVLITVWPAGTTATVLRSLRTTMLMVIAALVIQRIGLVWRAQHPRPTPPTPAEHDQNDPPH